MATSKRRINTSMLPSDILSYTDTEFYDVAKQIVGENATELLKIQEIRSAHSLMLIPDVFAILDINCAELEPLKDSICLKSNANEYVVRPGIKSSIEFFRE